MEFSIRFFYHTERGQEFIFARWNFDNSMRAEFHARKYAAENIPFCTKIMIEWNSGTEKKMRTLRKDENGDFKKGRK